MEGPELQLGCREPRLQEFAERVYSSLGPLFFDLNQPISEIGLLTRCFHLSENGIQFDICHRSIESYLFLCVGQAKVCRLDTNTSCFDVFALRKTESERLHRCIGYGRLTCRKANRWGSEAGTDDEIWDIDIGRLEKHRFRLSKVRISQLDRSTVLLSERYNGAQRNLCGCNSWRKGR